LNIIFIGKLSARPDDPVRNEMNVSSLNCDSHIHIKTCFISCLL